MTPKGLKLLAEHEPDLLPDISEDKILNRSKQTGMAKSVVCSTAFLFIIECAARIFNNLPISLLELNTFAHTLCTLLSYILWWHKPLNAAELIVVESERIRPLFAYMWLASHAWHQCDETIKELAREAQTQYRLPAPKSYEG